MPREKYQTRLPDDTAKRVDVYNAEHGISHAEGVRRLIQAGLEAEAEDDDAEAEDDDAEAEDDDADDGLERAAQSGTIIAVVIIGVIALLVLNLVASLGLI